MGAPGTEAGAGKIYVLRHDLDSGQWDHGEAIAGTEEDHIGAPVFITDSMIVSGSMTGSAHATVFARADGAWIRSGVVSVDGIEDGDGLDDGKHG